MKYLYLSLCLLSSLVSFSQENTTTTNEVTNDSEEVSFSVIEKVPVYSGCDKNMGNQALKQCMSSQIQAFVIKNFNLELLKSVGLTAGKHRINIQFKVDKEGNIIDVRAKAPHPELKKEAIRVVSLLPKMDRPGFQDGKPVIVPYGFPIVFRIDEPKPLTKKELRKLKKKNRS
ncbi:energy transducer TonB [Lacinutrix sp. C3R15]|uniref:energy transducer TonB n=1 Tax=Flavobacteriaceae TaxID=49546 RepID=UPI001C089F14|nr:MULTISPECIES: energy transducer TonB [Flavobacteriaceae]MBU2939994.1 energy transducer TonB [Lacinutrix sp. C3R15]MDO6623311.1 energy transducer TonB [Oceanihabitans sp. 1_MG-2023]